MAEEINTRKPNVGIRGNPQNLPELKSTERLVGAGSSPSYGAALTQLASTPTMLGEVGSRIMNSASISLAQRYGQSLGKNPQGNLLPPITNFDKNVSQSYMTQSQVTLGNEAQALLYKSQEEMAKYPKLNQGIINSFNESTKQGFAEIIDLAPDALKPQLEQQLTHQLQSTTHQYNERLISQQKADAEAKASVWRIHTNDAVTNMIKDAKTPEEFEAGKKTYESLIGNIESSNLSASQKDTAKTTAKLNYESAISINKLMTARANGKENEYLASIADKKIGGLSWSESESVRDNTVKYLSAVETADNRDQALQVSQAAVDMTKGQFNESSLASLRETLTPINFKKVELAFAKSQYKANSENLTLQSIVSNPGDATTYRGLTPKQINSGFDYLVNSKIQNAGAKGESLTLDEAEFQAASIMNTIVPKYVDRLNREMANGTPAQVMAGLEAYERMHELDGNKVLGIDSKGLMTAEIFKNMMASQSVDATTALINARQIVYNKDDKIIKNNNAIIAGYMDSHASTPERRISTAVSLSGISNSKGIDNQAAFTADVYSRFNGYMHLSNGDVEASKNRLQSDIAKIWGESRVNGKTQITRLGIEQAISMPLDSTPLIQADIISQLEPQLGALKALYDKGGSPHYWRIKSDRINYDDYAEAKLTILKEGLSDPKYGVHKKLINDFEKAPPIQLEQVSKKGIQIWHVDVQTSPYASRSPVTGKVSGFNIGIRHPETGEYGQLYGYYGATHTIPTYTPNEDWISDNYTGLSGIKVRDKKDYIKARGIQEQLINQNPSQLADYANKIIKQQEEKRGNR